jgi:UDP-2-acetamido-2-deoxy-ribo-hexuluronate aminotransferase
MKVPFVDLKTPYNAMKESINQKIQAVLDHGAFINGPEVAEVEKKLADYVGSKHCLTCASGTDALLIPMMALGIGPGDEVITTSFSFIATAETIVLAGATPVYVDIDPKTFNLDVKQVEKAITSKTKAIQPVSLYGQIADMDALNALAEKHGLFVIEDAAQSFGASYKNKKSCNLTTIGGTSFFPAKPLGCYGDGGAIFTNDEKLFRIMKEVREHGSESRYHHTRLGVNGRLDTLQCAILLAKLERYPWELEQRNKIAKKYSEHFSGIKTKGFSFPFIEKHNVSAWAQYTLTVNDRAEFQKRMNEVGIPTSVHYPKTMPDQPWYKGHDGRVIGNIEHARKAAETVVSIPMFPDMTEDVQNYICQNVTKALT